MDIKIKNLNKKIEDIPILKNINLNFKSKSINVIIGPNGAGKTTLLRIIGLLDEPTSGEVFYNENSSYNFNSQEKINYRRKIGFVFQNPIILEGTVYQNIVLGLKFRKLKIEKNKVENIISQVGLLDKINQDTKKLSGGEKQRLQLARVLVVKPNIFLFDEPTANLDPYNVEMIENLILSLKKDTTIIFTTHNLYQAKRIADEVFLLINGEIIEQGVPSKIFNNPSNLVTKNFIDGKMVG